MQNYINIMLGKYLLHGELVLIATIITLSITNNAEYENIINKTEYTSVNNDLLVAVPLHYNGKIRFFFEDTIVFGECSIIINISQSLKSITMHSVPISVIDAILIDDKNETVYKLFNSSFNEEKNILILNFDERLSHAIFPNTFTLKIAYMRIMHENGNLGFFIRSDQEKLNDQMLDETGVAVMKARQLFPCREELTINSTFKIAIKHEAKYTVLSNIPIRARNKADNGMVWTDFDESLSISAQHISVVMTTFTNVSSQLANVTIWCRQSAQNHVLYAKNVIEQVWPYFKREYLKKLSKLDIVAFWHHHNYYDIATLRLVLLREADIIYNETMHPVIRQREVAHIIARQLTLLWCDDALLWSKEGFAAFFGAYILDQIYQNNYMLDLMVMQAHQDSLRYDGNFTINSQILNSTSTSKDNSLRRPLNYMKSFIIWRMLYHIIPDVFRRGIRTYIDSRSSYSNMRTQDDLWTTLQTIYNETYPNHMLSFHLKEIIISWITKECYPILYIKRHYWNLTLVISHIQSPYLLVNNKTLIWIPVTLTTQSSLNFDKTDDSLFWLTSQNPEYPILGVSKKDWFIVNIQQVGYYRVKYDLQNWQKLMRYLNSENYNKVHILNRAQIIDDAFYFLIRRELDYNMFWNLTSFMLRDLNFVTWYPMFKAFEFMTCIFPFQISFHALYSMLTLERMKNRIEQLLAEIGYYEEPTDHILTIYLRQEAVKWACIFGISQCRIIAALELDKELANSIENNNLIGKEWIYCYGLTTANHSIWYKVWNKWNVTSDERFLEYLTCSKDSIILCHFMEIVKVKESRYNESIRISMPTNIFLLIVAKHAQRDAVHSCLFRIIEEITLNSNRRNDIIATLIVVISHVHTEEHMLEIIKFATRVLKEKRLVESIKKKLRKRKLEYMRLVQNYGYYFSQFVES